MPLRRARPEVLLMKPFYAVIPKDLNPFPPDGLYAVPVWKFFCLINEACEIIDVDDASL